MSLALLPLACTKTGSGGDGCGWVRPIYVSADDKLSDQTAAAILGHDQAWAAVCRR